MSLRVRVAVLAVVGVLALIGIGVIARSYLALGALYPWKAAAAYAAGMAVVIAHVDGHHPFPRFGAANLVTMIRAMLVALLMALIGEPATPGIAAAAVVATAIITALDGVDGWLARRTPMVSAFGARFDMETDALLIMVLSVLVWQYGKAGAWVLLGGLMRYAFVAAGWLLPWLARPLRPTLRGRVTAVAHMLGLGVALAPVVPLPVSAIVAALTLAALVASFSIDVMRLWRGDGLRTADYGGRQSED